MTDPDAADGPRPAEAAWRPVVAALLNDDARVAYAHLVLSHSEEEAFAGLSPSRRRRVRDALTTAGLVRDVGGELAVHGDDLRPLLASHRPRQTGVQRFLDTEGRIRGYPARAADRVELLAFVASRALAADEAVTEAELGERLAAFTTDVAALRRYLVDAGLLHRAADGSDYRLA